MKLRLAKLHAQPPSVLKLQIYMQEAGKNSFDVLFDG
jgi:hypothetical protein